MGILATSTHQKWIFLIEGLPSLKGYVSFRFQGRYLKGKKLVVAAFLRPLLTNSGEFMT